MNFTSQDDLIQIPENSKLSDLNIDVSILWSGQQMQYDSGVLIINEMQGENLIASRVEAAIGSQDFFSSGTTTLGDDGNRCIGTIKVTDRANRFEAGEVFLWQGFNYDSEIIDDEFDGDEG